MDRNCFCLIFKDGVTNIFVADPNEYNTEAGQIDTHPR
jgi:hypothetical protein